MGQGWSRCGRYRRLAGALHRSRRTSSADRGRALSEQPRIYLSPPHQTGREAELLDEALTSNWLAPLGPQVDAFEREFGAVVEVPHAAALASGTAALHLALRLLGVSAGDRVLCSTLTFVATANAITYVGAQPVFIDSEERSWNMDPDLLEEELESSREDPPRAVVAVDIYGQCADYQRIEQICRTHGVPLIEDAAEALGATCGGKPAGSFGDIGVFSFNGNKIVTSSGGGMLVAKDADLVERTRFLASQARDSALHYQHSELGYNYRMSNLLAAVGRAQLETLTERVEDRRRIFNSYSELLGGLEGLEFMPEANHGRSSRWLTCLTLDPATFGSTPAVVCEALGRENIEARPLWKPMHLQPLYRECRFLGGSLSERLFETGLCLPSGFGLTSSDLERICDTVKACHRSRMT